MIVGIIDFLALLGNWGLCDPESSATRNNNLTGNIITGQLSCTVPPLNFDCAGIRLDGVSNNLISDTILNSNDRGIVLDSSSDNTIQNNTLTDNTLDGISILSSSNNRIVNTVIDNSGDNSILLSCVGVFNNKFINVTIINADISTYDINFSSPGIDGTRLVNTHIGNYTFTGIGNGIGSS